jgi:hypothetical protein
MSHAVTPASGSLVFYGRTDDLKVVFGSQCLHLGQIGWGRWGDGQRFSRFAHFGVESFQPGRNGELQQSGRLCAFNQEAMGYVPGQINEGPGFSVPAMFTTDERELSFEDIERLIFCMMDMHRWSEAGWQDLLDETERLAIILSRRFEKHERAEKPDGLPLLACQDVGFIT